MPLDFRECWKQYFRGIRAAKRYSGKYRNFYALQVFSTCYVPPHDSPEYWSFAEGWEKGKTVPRKP